MARVKKEFRELTVSEATNYGRRTAPMLRIQGLWLEKLGFNKGDPVLVKCKDGKLIVTVDKDREAMMVAEKAFYDAESKKLKDRYDAEKKALHAKIVAERSARYNGRKFTIEADCVADQLLR
ncbi:Endoribonuclease SymE [Blautia producta]|uniref:Endoribonuclease SymE n=1 Tax=Blautia producta TaxID=33035 RepID=A0A4P6LZ32_9FIRM|nr:SymE family type I addiction module toxin [Blautia producta]QBE97974.1 Endoribonuclease SymE [Blautia producta]